jgi:hypothetical protein
VALHIPVNQEELLEEAEQRIPEEAVVVEQVVEMPDLQQEVVDLVLLLSLIPELQRLPQEEL